MAHVRLREAGRDVVVEGEWQVHGQNFSLNDLQGTYADGVLRIGERVIPYYGVCASGGGVEIWMHGKVYRLQPDLPKPAAERTQAGGSVTAPMPGTVLELKVQEGDLVDARSPVLVLESMKMEMTLTAPGAGRVRQVNCRRGDLVEMGALLVVVEPHEEAT